MAVPLFVQFILWLSPLLPANTPAPEVKAISFARFEEMSSVQNDTTYVFNFWATWCKPCVHELPAFEALGQAYAGKKLKVVLISLDFVKQMDSHLIPFVKKNHIKSAVYLLNDPDYNSWIDKVSPEWSGALPGTLVVNNGKKYRKFYEQEFSREQLEEIIEPITE